MSEIIEFGGGEFELLAKNMPKDSKKIYNLEGSEKLVVVEYGESSLYSNPFIITAWLGTKELGLSLRDREELEAMLGFAQDNQRQDIAEGGS